MRRPLLSLLTTAFALGGVIAAAPPAAATGSCGSSPTITGVATGNVGPDNVADWWHYESLVGVHAVTVTAAPVPVTLAVYDGSCNLLCETHPTVGQLNPGVCVITTPTLVLNIEVSHFGSPFNALYVLTVA